MGLSGLWIAAAVAVAFLIAERPTASNVADRVGRSCDFDMPVPSELAGRVLEVPTQLAKINSLGGDANASARKPFVEAAKGTVEALATRDGKAADYDMNVLGNATGETRIILAPAHFTEAQVLEQAEKEKYASNSWNKFAGYCIEQLGAQARDEIYPRKLKEWAIGTLAGLLSFPLISLVLGTFIGWVWRGFRISKMRGKD